MLSPIPACGVLLPFIVLFSIFSLLGAQSGETRICYPVYEFIVAWFLGEKVVVFSGPLRALLFFFPSSWADGLRRYNAEVLSFLSPESTCAVSLRPIISWTIPSPFGCIGVVLSEVSSPILSFLLYGSPATAQRWSCRFLPFSSFRMRCF